MCLSPLKTGMMTLTRGQSFMLMPLPASLPARHSGGRAQSHPTLDRADDLFPGEKGQRRLLTSLPDFFAGGAIGKQCRNGSRACWAQFASTYAEAARSSAATWGREAARLNAADVLSSICFIVNSRSTVRCPRIAISATRPRSFSSATSSRLNAKG